ncbi:hypothetical protein [Amycolatopsis sp. cmx-4-68]|uniref:hypothetical protein n=1 Tax=Amycolatopsis sp. cmx-4-68 TaxID=2790938 RepID=UPI00397C115C
MAEYRKRTGNSTAFVNHTGSTSRRRGSWNSAVTSGVARTVIANCALSSSSSEAAGRAISARTSEPVSKTPWSASWRRSSAGNRPSSRPSRNAGSVAQNTDSLRCTGLRSCSDAVVSAIDAPSASVKTRARSMSLAAGA